LCIFAAMSEQPLIFPLKNGIRVVHQPMQREVAHCGIMIGAGSRDELTREHGLAHFMEHGLFKGTTKRKTYHILSRLDAVGGELNAFTSKEETWIHASFLKEHYERAIELIADIAFNATFPAKEIEKEKEVILDEINSYKDSPAEMIFEEFDEIIFGKHPIGRTILGTEKSLRSFTHTDLINFRKRNFTDKNIIFSSAGDISERTVKLLAEKYLVHHKLIKAKKTKAIDHGYKAIHKVEKKEIHQVHYLMGTPAYDFNHEFRPGLTLLNNILGGPAMNNRLSMNIREKHGIAYHVDSSYAPFSDCGVFSIYLGTEKNNLEKSKALIWKELNLLKKTKLSTRQLHEAKKQIMAQIAISQDSGGSLMFNLGKSLMLFGRIDTMQEIYERVEAITAKHLHEIANEIFDEKKMSSLTYTY
jgi:predicted Zn-dependent peptidase